MNIASKKSLPLFWLSIFLAYFSFSAFTLGANSSSGIYRQFLGSNVLTELPGFKLTSVVVEFDPGVNANPHRHEGFVYIYVLEGRVISQIDGGEIVEYKAGETWIEPPGVVHTLTINPSKTEKAKILAIFVAKDGAKLSVPVQHE